MFVLNKPVISLLFPMLPTCAEPLFQRGSCDVTKGGRALSRRLWSSLLKDHLWPTIGCRAKGTSYSLFPKTLHSEPHPIQKEFIASFSSTGTACLSFPVTICTLIPSHQVTCSPYLPLLLSEGFPPLKDASKKCSLPLFDFIEYTCWHIFVCTVFLFFSVLFQVCIFNYKVSETGTRSYIWKVAWYRRENRIWNQTNLALNPMLCWISYLTSLCLSFVIYKMGIRVVIS